MAFTDNNDSSTPDEAIAKGFFKLGHDLVATEAGHIMLGNRTIMHELFQHMDTAAVHVFVGGMLSNHLSKAAFFQSEQGRAFHTALCEYWPEYSAHPSVGLEGIAKVMQLPGSPDKQVG